MRRKAGENSRRGNKSASLRATDACRVRVALLQTNAVVDFFIVRLIEFVRYLLAARRDRLISLQRFITFHSA